jgi:hypothetical protein
MRFKLAVRFAGYGAGDVNKKRQKPNVALIDPV